MFARPVLATRTGLANISGALYSVNMPTRNRVKIYGEDQFYHVYNRGVNKEDIFKDDADYVYFLSLLKRHLSPGESVDKYGRLIRKYDDKIELVAYCLMPNHYHLLCYLKDPEGLVGLTRSVMTAYTMYFNKKYKRVGPLYQERFLASNITSDFYLWHVSRYIHLNPITIGKNFRTYPYSSIDYYVGKKQSEWLHTERLVEKTEEKAKYLGFVSDYETMHKELDELKRILAAS